MSPEAGAMLERAKYFAQFLGHEMIRPEHILAGYMMIEQPHRMLNPRMTTQAVFDAIFLATSRGTRNARVKAVALPQSLDSESRAIIEIAVQAAVEIDRPIEARDLMTAILKHYNSEAVDVIIAVTSTTPDELLENLLQQPA